MQLFICSDIHGDRSALEKTIEAFHNAQADYMICLGDLLNHGPRNTLPESYDPLAVAADLNQIKERIISVRGNCDSEVDQALCEFPMLSEYNQMLIGKRRAFFCHGHTFSPDNLPVLAHGDIFISGHTHIPQAQIHKEIYLLNPGSVAIPRQNWPASYALLEESKMEVFNLDDHSSLLSCEF